MPKFSVVFIIPSDKSEIKHRIITPDDQEGAIKAFFEGEATSYYSNDEQGYFYFKEDFFDRNNPSGSVLSCD